MAAVANVVVPLLNGSCAGSTFRPTLEQLVSLVTVLAEHCAVLSVKAEVEGNGGRQADGSTHSFEAVDRTSECVQNLQHAVVWSKLTQTATDSLAAAVQDHPTPKKVGYLIIWCW